MRKFQLHRDVDPTGIAGTGIVAQGVEFDDGTVALRWLTEWPTSVVFHDRGMEAVLKVHGHGGQTRVVFEDDDEYVPSDDELTVEEFEVEEDDEEDETSLEEEFLAGFNEARAPGPATTATTPQGSQPRGRVVQRDELPPPS
jgi:hypothetical protein